MQKLLIVDDEESVLYSLEKGLGSSTVEILTADTARGGIERFRGDKPDAMILDVRLPDMSGLDAYDEIRKIDSRVPVIIITAHATTETAIEATKRGAFEYLLKPLDLQQLRSVVNRALELSRLSRVPTVFDDSETTDQEGDRIVGRAPAMQEIYKAIGRVAGQDVTVLILGESGTGKELVSRAIYQYSKRNERPFLAINCAAIPESLLESEMFGHEKGSFTGAHRGRIGKFEQANGGTIFLDEIGDMTPATQAKLLRVLQDQKFERVGGNETIETDVRVIAATNQNLEELIKEGKFRSDLYYRLNVFTIRLPALRERLVDLPLLLDHFLKRFNRELGKQIRSISPEVMSCLEKHQWPGNVRELQSTAKYALINATGDVLTIDCLPDTLRCPKMLQDLLKTGTGEMSMDVAKYIDQLLESGQPELYQAVHGAVDRILLEKVINHVKGNQVEASELLGVARNTLRSKLRALGLSLEKQLQSSPEDDPGKGD